MVMRSHGRGLGFFERISRGWKMTRLGMAVVRADPELMVYTFLSAVFSLVAIGAAISGSFGFSAVFAADCVDCEPGDGFWMAHLTIWFFFYLVISVIIVFWNAAIVASAYERLSSGSNPSFSYGIGQAMKCLPQILVWGVISGTIGLVLKILEGVSKDSGAPIPLRAIAGIASFILGIAWWVATFFVVPMIVLERAGVINSMSKSGELFKKTWGENIASYVGVELLVTLWVLLLFGVSVPLMMLGEIGVALGLVILSVGLIFTILFFSTVDAVNRASLYYYAKTGHTPPMAAKAGIRF